MATTATDANYSTVPWLQSAASTASKTEKSTNAASYLGKDAFLQLLITELQNQDPTNPTSNTEFVAQLAQFSSLEKLENIANSISSMSVMQSAGLIGKTAIAEMDGTNIIGMVEAILIQDSVPYAVIDGKNVPVSSITQISQGDE